MTCPTPKPLCICRKLRHADPHLCHDSWLAFDKRAYSFSFAPLQNTGKSAAQIRANQARSKAQTRRANGKPQLRVVLTRQNTLDKLRRIAKHKFGLSPMQWGDKSMAERRAMVAQVTDADVAEWDRRNSRRFAQAVK